MTKQLDKEAEFLKKYALFFISFSQLDSVLGTFIMAMIDPYEKNKNFMDMVAYNKAFGEKLKIAKLYIKDDELKRKLKEINNARIVLAHADLELNMKDKELSDILAIQRNKKYKVDIKFLTAKTNMMIKVTKDMLQIIRKKIADYKKENK